MQFPRRGRGGGWWRCRSPPSSSAAFADVAAVVAHFMRLDVLHEHTAHHLRSQTGPSADPQGVDHN